MPLPNLHIADICKLAKGIIILLLLKQLYSHDPNRVLQALQEL
jgi:hypothetical protein